MKILVADDHPLIRHGLKQLMADYGITASVEEAGNGSEALRKVMDWDPDMVLLDIHMPGKTGLQVLKEIRKKKPRLPVLMLSLVSEREFAIEALRAGASGYISKDSPNDELIAAIRRVLSGKRYFSPDVAEMLVTADTGKTEKLPAKLSPRESDVLNKIVEGKRIKQIAEEMCCSPKTVSTYRRRILDKMNMTSNAELIRSSIKTGGQAEITAE